MADPWADPLEGLQTPIVPMAPDPVFATRLRQRLENLLTREEHDMTETQIPTSLARNGTRHGDVSYITLAVPDADRCRRFYGHVLSWTFAAGGSQAEGVIPQVGLWPGSAWREGIRPGAILSWRVDDIAAVVEAVRAAGGTATEPEAQPYGLQSECTDGLGLRFWLHQLPASGEPAGPNGQGHGDISYLVLKVADLDRAQGFFSTLLGWSFTPGHTGVNVEGPVPMTGMAEGEAGAVLCYRVDDIMTAVDRVADSGGRAGAVEARPYGLEALCADDQGIEFYLHQLEG